MYVHAYACSVCMHHVHQHIYVLCTYIRMHVHIFESNGSAYKIICTYVKDLRRDLDNSTSSLCFLSVHCFKLIFSLQKFLDQTLVYRDKVSIYVHSYIHMQATYRLYYSSKLKLCLHFYIPQIEDSVFKSYLWLALIWCFEIAYVCEVCVCICVSVSEAINNYLCT